MPFCFVPTCKRSERLEDVAICDRVTFIEDVYWRGRMGPATGISVAFTIRKCKILLCISPRGVSGQSRLVITEAKDVLQVQDEYGEVMCRLGTVDDDACDICEKAVANTPILYIQKAQDDSWYDDVSCTLCKPCMLAMFKVFEDKLDNRK